MTLAPGTKLGLYGGVGGPGGTPCRVFGCDRGCSVGAAGLRLRHGLSGGREGQLAPGPCVK
jgi:hypothetical protein